jgi:hypothetical protein
MRKILLALVLISGAVCMADDVPCFSDRPEMCPQIIYGPTHVVPDGKLHPYTNVPGHRHSCQEAGAICQKTT